MQRLKDLFLKPPVGTGYWCSLSRALFGALLAMRIFDPPMTPAYFQEAKSFIFLLIYYVLAVFMMLGILTKPMLFVNAALCIAGYYINAFKLENLWQNPYSGPGSFGVPTNIYFLGVMLLFLAFTPCADYFSLESYWRKRKPSPPRPLWGAQLIVLQISAMYFWAAAAKTHPLFRSGISLELSFIRNSVGSFGYFHQAEMMPLFQVLSWATIVFEFSLAILIFVPRFRKFGLGLGFFFHMAAVVFFPVRNYTLAIWVAYLVLLETIETSKSSQISHPTSPER